MKNTYFIYLVAMLLFIGCSKKTPIQAHSSTPISGDNLFTQKNIVISERIDLRGKTIRLKNQNISFNTGGQITNGTLFCDVCTITAKPEVIFQNVTLAGDWSANRAYVEWLLGSQLKDAKENFVALNTLLQAGFKIKLITLLPIEAASSTAVANPSRNIHIEGSSKEKSGLILMTKHKNRFYNYFQSDRGVNLHLENMSIISDDFQKGILLESNPEYFFSGSSYQRQYNPMSKPSLDSIVVQNCNIKGNIILANYAAHSDNQTKEEFWGDNMIKRLHVASTTFQNISTGFIFSNIGYGNIIFEDNKIYDMYSTLLFIPESGMDTSYYEGLRKNKKKVVIRNNIFKNSKPYEHINVTYFSPFVIKGGYSTMEFYNNQIEDLLSINSKVAVYPVYFACRKPGMLIAKNNRFKNVINKGSTAFPASLFIQKSATPIVLENNHITIDKEALVKIDVLKSVKQPLNSIDGSQFYMEFFRIGEQTEFTKEVIVSNNYFEVPIVNGSTEIFDLAEFVFENNTVKIEYFGPSKVTNIYSEDNTFFLGRKIFDLPANQVASNFKSKGNAFFIGSTGGGLFRYVSYPHGMQSGKDGVIDSNFNYKAVLFQDTFYVNNTNVQISLPDGYNQNYNPVIKGSNNSFTLVDVANAFTFRPNAEKMSSHIKIENANWDNTDKSPFVFIPNSSQKLEVGQHSGKTIHLLNYIFFNSLFTLAQNDDIIVQIQLRGVDNEGKVIHQENYLNLNQKARMFYIENRSGQYKEINPSDKNGRTEALMNYEADKNAASSPLELVFETGDKSFKDAKIYYTNCNQIRQYEVTCRIYNAGKNPLDQKQFRNKIKQITTPKSSK